MIYICNHTLFEGSSHIFFVDSLIRVKVGLGISVFVDVRRKVSLMNRIYDTQKCVYLLDLVFIMQIYCMWWSTLSLNRLFTNTGTRLLIEICLCERDVRRMLKPRKAWAWLKHGSQEEMHLDGPIRLTYLYIFLVFNYLYGLNLLSNDLPTLILCLVCKWLFRCTRLFRLLPAWVYSGFITRLKLFVLYPSL